LTAFPRRVIIARRLQELHLGYFGLMSSSGPNPEKRNFAGMIASSSQGWISLLPNPFSDVKRVARRRRCGMGTGQGESLPGSAGKTSRRLPRNRDSHGGGQPLRQVGIQGGCHRKNLTDF